MVGGTGGRQLVGRLMSELPNAEFHLGGHSFGSKFWLSALDGPGELPRKVNSLMLLQAAVSAYAFADRVPGDVRPGGYRAVLNQVNGPIIATHTSRDWLLSWAYPVGSRLAGQVGELERAAEVNRYAALGAVGAARAGKRTTIRNAGDAYELGPPALWSVDAGDKIPGHSELGNRDVSWLLWSAIRSD